MASVTIKNLKKKYGKSEAVDNLNLEIRDGEFFVLLGPSGCGKTTTLLCVAGLINPDDGEILLGDEIVTSREKRLFLRPQERDVAMVFQDYAIYPHLTVFRNISFPLEVRGVDKEIIEKKVKEVSESLGIGELLSRKPAQLSGGQRQRVALARAIVREPKVFLMDEPLSNLDAKLRVAARAELKKLHERIKTTIIYVTHDQVEAMSIGDRIAILNQGHLEQVGTPREVYENPANIFVASFIGSPPMNFFPGILKREEGIFSVDLGFSKIPLPKKIESSIQKKGISLPLEVTAGIRPEHVEVVKDGQGLIRGKIDVIELVGKEFIVHLDLSGWSLVSVTSATLELSPGEDVGVFLDPERMHLFESNSGKTLLQS
ncbi:MAG: ABC transporter ATP-binding protein [Caldiserica bacterium]|jgi:multiple sugar transport system ATP-binding protein|nr:ABC transporter ATP-binding protein [Caldisericota bacterium]MDH7562149.1 ABC transporter ATP-binding protein [Caldisericota bacterium]